MDINKFFQNKFFKATIIGISVFIVMLLILRLGMLIGAGRANFAFQWSENYHRNFAGPQGGFLQDFAERDFIEAHGVFGRIIKIDLPSLIIAGDKNAERAVILNDKTMIKFLRDSVQASGLKVDDNIVVVGAPNGAGQLEAELIRILPTPPTKASILGGAPATSTQPNFVPMRPTR